MVKILYLTHVFLNGNKWFSEGWEGTEDDQCPSWLIFVLFPQTVTKINEIGCGNRRMSIRMIAETVNIDEETVRKILQDELNIKKVCVKLVLKNFTPDQKLVCQQIYTDFLEKLDEETEMMENIATYNETWIFNVESMW